MMPLAMSTFNKRSSHEPISPPRRSRLSRKVIALADGQRAQIEFDSITSAAKHFGVAPGAVANSINCGHRAANRRFCFAEDLEKFSQREDVPRGLSRNKPSHTLADNVIEFGNEARRSKYESLLRAAKLVIEKSTGPVDELLMAIASMKRVVE